MSRILSTILLVCLCATAILVAAASASGAVKKSTATQTVMFENQTAVQLDLQNTAPFDFGQVSPLAVVNPAGPDNVAVVHANAPWRLMVRAAAPTFNEYPAGTHTVPVGRLRVTGATAVTLSTTDQQISAGLVGTPNGGRNVRINYRLALLMTDPANTPGSSYQQTLIYTAVTP